MSHSLPDGESYNEVGQTPYTRNAQGLHLRNHQRSQAALVHDVAARNGDLRGKAPALPRDKPMEKVTLSHAEQW